MKRVDKKYHLYVYNMYSFTWSYIIPILFEIPLSEFIQVRNISNNYLGVEKDPLKMQVKNKKGYQIILHICMYIKYIYTQRLCGFSYKFGEIRDSIEYGARYMQSFIFVRTIGKSRGKESLVSVWLHTSSFISIGTSIVILARASYVFFRYDGLQIERNDLRTIRH